MFSSIVTRLWTGLQRVQVKGDQFTSLHTVKLHNFSLSKIRFGFLEKLFRLSIKCQKFELYFYDIQQRSKFQYSNWRNSSHYSLCWNVCIVKLWQLSVIKQVCSFHFQFFKFISKWKTLARQLNKTLFQDIWVRAVIALGAMRCFFCSPPKQITHRWIGSPTRTKNSARICYFDSIWYGGTGATRISSGMHISSRGANPCSQLNGPVPYLNKLTSSQQLICQEDEKNVNKKKKAKVC